MVKRNEVRTLGHVRRWYAVEPRPEYPNSRPGSSAHSSLQFVVNENVISRVVAMQRLWIFFLPTKHCNVSDLKRTPQM